jgi:nitrogen regulatory protein PII
MIHFLQIEVQSKSSDDWRSFLQYADDETMTVYEIRGYGSTPGQAADDAMRRYQEDPEFYIEDSWEWK